MNFSAFVAPAALAGYRTVTPYQELLLEEAAANVCLSAVRNDCCNFQPLGLEGMQKPSVDDQVDRALEHENVEDASPHWTPTTSASAY
ncbi:hypothetical protein DIPPA_13234 [Diplonema papillatum]|nr:hypothetical protein DIPPA_13234 [Diplonema papillatum]